MKRKRIHVPATPCGNCRRDPMYCSSGCMAWKVWFRCVWPLVTGRPAGGCTAKAPVAEQ